MRTELGSAWRSWAGELRNSVEEQLGEACQQTESRLLKELEEPRGYLLRS